MLSHQHRQQTLGNPHGRHYGRKERRAVRGEIERAGGVLRERGKRGIRQRNDFAPGLPRRTQHIKRFTRVWRKPYHQHDIPWRQFTGYGIAGPETTHIDMLGGIQNINRLFHCLRVFSLGVGKIHPMGLFRPCLMCFMAQAQFLNKRGFELSPADIAQTLSQAQQRGGLDADA
ncbi:hypothetical protein BBAD15_g10912 [Beauveria bassiana D1-5]|uniref:Uncharacterized protein n=1 Tax=Beauveria bassiana D1-5 TaxID=1245745 RepID=A0A0A2VBX2_BEABA|nr:hypothetical protein BBAD15_g10912 [Beauveria bassiana D1-5]